MSAHRVRGATLAAALLAPGSLHAQATDAAWPGLGSRELPTVYVLDDAGAETSGALLRLEPDAIVLQVGNVERRIEATRVKRIQRRGDTLRNGAIIGAVAGAAIGVLVGGVSDCPGGSTAGGCLGARAFTLLVSTGLYAATGAGIDAAFVGRTMLYTAPAAASSSTSARARPQHGRRAAIILSARW